MFQRTAARTFVSILVGISLVLLLTSTIAAQIRSSGRIVGIVEDATKGVLPGVTVTATAVGKGTETSTITDQAGRYTMTVLPGDYDVTASLPGFGTQLYSGITVTVGEARTVNFTLQVGEISEQITVEGGAPLVDTRSSTMSSLVSTEAVHNLPLNGRSFDQLITLSAGTVNFRNRADFSGTRGIAANFSAGGTRPTATKLSIDGVEYSGATMFSNVSTASGNLLGVESIQEFAVVTHTADATYGKRPGAQVTMVTRSGTNDFHGSVFEFARNDVFDARNFFDGAEPPPLRRHNYGFSFGGPIARDRTFFFGSLERLEESRGLTLRSVVPDAQVRQGIFPDGTVLPVNPDVRPLLDLYPEPNGRNFGDGTAESINSRTNTIEQTQAVVRVDHHFSDQDRLFGRYWIDSGERFDFNDGGLGLFAETNPVRVQLFTLGYTRVINPRVVNEVNFAFNRSHLVIDFVPGEGVTIPPQMILVPGEDQQGGVRVGVTSGGGTTQLPTLGGRGSVGTAGRFFVRNSFEYSDQLQYTTGPHSLRFGAEIQRVQNNEFGGTQPRGFLQFGSLENFVLGRPSRIRGPLPGSDAIKGWRRTYLGLYVQDDWQVTRRFTLNLGLRWEFMNNPTEVNGKISRHVPEGSHLTLPIPDDPIIVDRVFAENNSGNFAPRIGFAWDLFGNGRTALRSAAGVYYAQIEDEFRRELGAAAPFWNRVQVRNPPFPDPGQVLGEGSVGRLTANGVHERADIPTVLQYNLGIEHQFGSNNVFSISYAGSHSYHIGRDTNPQVPPPFVNADGRLELPQNLLNPNLASSSDFFVWDSVAFYNSLQVEFERRFHAGLRFKAAFTWSKTIDEGVDNNSAPIGNEDTTVVASDHRFDRALAPFHVGRQLVFNWSYDLPFGRRRGVPGVLLNDWELLGIVQISDGNPFTPVIGFGQSFEEGSLSGQERPDLAPGASINPALGGPDQYFDPNAFVLPPPRVLGTLGKGTVIGPGFATVDFSVFKNFHITEESFLQFRAEFFNILNRTNFGLPDNSLFQPDGSRRGRAGRISETVSTSREIQFALKFVF